MRFSIGATAALAAAVVRAEEPAAEASSSTSVAKPTFTVGDAPVLFLRLELTIAAAYHTQGPLP